MRHKSRFENSALKPNIFEDNLFFVCIYAGEQFYHICIVFCIDAMRIFMCYNLAKSI